jgi:hypothetical protein
VLVKVRAGFGDIFARRLLHQDWGMMTAMNKLTW